MCENRQKANVGTCECIKGTLGEVGPACAEEGKGE